MFQLTTRTTPKMASFAAKLSFPPVPSGLVGQSIKCLLFPLSPYSLLHPATHLTNSEADHFYTSVPVYNIFARLSRWHLLAFPRLNPVNTSTGPTPFSARRLEPDWSISAALDGSLQISSPRPWKVLPLSNGTGGSKYSIDFKSI